MSTYINEGRGISLNIQRLEAPPFLKEYLRYILVNGEASQQTVRTYYTQIRIFLRWLSMRERGAEITKETLEDEPISAIPFSMVENVSVSDIDEFLAFCQLGLNNDVTTKRTKIAALSSFFQYEIDLGRIEKSPIRFRRTGRKGKKEPKHLSHSEAVSLLDSVVGQNKERNSCIITFFVNCGMRLSELVGINLKDIKEGSLLLRGKGRKERTIYLNEACLSALDLWMSVRSKISDADKKDALFISPRTGGRITARQVEYIVENTMKRAGLSGLNYTTHTLRHTAATLMYQESDADILTLQAILGHQNVATTSIYTHMNQDQVRAAMENSPLSKERNHA